MNAKIRYSVRIHDAFASYESTGSELKALNYGSHAIDGLYDDLPLEIR